MTTSKITIVCPRCGKENDLEGENVTIGTILSKPQHCDACGISFFAGKDNVRISIINDENSSEEVKNLPETDNPPEENEDEYDDFTIPNPLANKHGLAWASGIILVIIVGILALKKMPDIKNSELYNVTDRMVESLYTTYDSYGLLGGEERYTPDGEYRVLPVGRLVNVRIEHYASEQEYEKLRKELEKHYKGNWRVNRVYICEGGTVMIDCRR